MGARIVERFSDTYTEISPSGAGLRIWARGAVPANFGGLVSLNPYQAVDLRKQEFATIPILEVITQTFEFVETNCTMRLRPIRPLNRVPCRRIGTQLT